LLKFWQTSPITQKIDSQQRLKEMAHSLFSLVRKHTTIHILSLIALVSSSASVGAAPATDDLESDHADPMLELSLEELMQVVVTSVSRKAQTLAQTAAAAHVIQAEDIRRSGASSIPEALRLAPGVQVSAIGNNKWAVSIRGQADRFSNKLLVLVDGRSVYSPMFSGVVWEYLDTPLENIERIEVIRGPGASVWGANAVNGVINIITRSAFDTPGGSVALAAGSELRGYGLARFGWNPDPDTAIQLYAKAQDTDASRFVSGGKGVDDWRMQSAGFRLEHLIGNNTLRLQGGLNKSRAGDEIMMITPSAITPLRQTQQFGGGHLLGRWESAPAETRQDSFQVYLEHSDYDHLILSELRTTLDVEYQQTRLPAANHELTWGLGYRYSQDEIGTSSLISLLKTEAATIRYSAYLQDEISLQPERWRLSLGARLEHNDYTGFELQPNLRLLWTPDTQTSIWFSAARAIRTPSRVERGGTVTLPLSPVSALQLDNGLASEERLDALDLGWRYQSSHRFSIDLAAFSYQYDNLRDASIIGSPIPQAGGYVFIPTINRNANRAKASGVEASMDWRLRPDLRLQAAYSFQDANVRLAPGRLASGYADTTPTHILSLRSALDLSSTLRGDAWLRHVSRISNTNFSVPAHTTLDLRLAWQPKPDLEISLVGQNLLDDAHQEYGSSYILSSPSEVQRGLYIKADWTF
jgi:iron complex outermembrane receptor protein